MGYYEGRTITVFDGGGGAGAGVGAGLENLLK